MNNCPVCQTSLADLDGNALFCMECGTNLWLQEKSNLSAQFKQKYQQELDQYLFYAKMLEASEGLDESLDAQYQRVRVLQEDIKAIEWDKRGATYDLKIKERQYKEMKGLSLTALKKRLQGNHQQELQRREERYESEKENYEAVENQEVILQQQLQQAQQDLEVLVELNRERVKFKRWQTHILEKLTNGVKISGEQALLDKIAEVEQQNEILMKRYNNYRMAKKLLHDAKRNLQSASSSVGTAKTGSTFDLLSSSIYGDVIKHRAVSNAQQYRAAAMSKIAQARAHVKSLRSIEEPSISGGNGIADVVFDGLGIDLASRFKLNQSSSSITNTINQIDGSLHGIDNIAGRLEEQYYAVSDQLRQLKQQLNALRTEYVETHLVVGEP